MIYKYLFIGVLVLGVLSGVFFKGMSCERKRWIDKQNQETLRRIDEGNKSVERSNEFKEKVNKSRSVKPVDDARDSCLLSSNNPAKECGKSL